MNKRKFVFTGREICVMMAILAALDPAVYAQAETRSLIEKCKAARKEARVTGVASFRVIDE